MELESESIINAYLEILVRRYNGINTTKSAFIDTFAITAIWNNRTPRIKIEPMDHKISVGVINSNPHWTIMALYPHEKKSLLLDPLGESELKLKTVWKRQDDFTARCYFCEEEEHEADFNWIQCDICPRWYHQMCVDSPAPEEAFLCPACIHVV